MNSLRPDEGGRGRAIRIGGPLEGVGPESETFLGPKIIQKIMLPMYQYLVFIRHCGQNHWKSLEGMGPDPDFLRPNGTRFAICHFRAQKSLNF